MPRDYYQTLGVGKTASPDEIKKAYRKLALEHHPDRAGKDAEAKFKEINEAYQVLSNPEKRGRYDQFGSAEGPAGFDGAGGYRTNVDFGDLFGRRGSGGGAAAGGFGFGNISDIFEDMMGEAFAQVQTEVNLKLSDLLLGREITLDIGNNDTVKLKIPPGTPPGTTFRFTGKGNTHKRGQGDLYITVRLEFPRKLSKEQERAMEELRKTGL